MNHHHVNRSSGAAIGIVLAILLFIALVVIVRFSVSVPAVDADRGASISKSLGEIRKTENNALANPGWVDQPRGIVRLPIEMAMQLIGSESPENVRADLMARQEKANAPAPKVAPKPSQFE